MRIVDIGSIDITGDIIACDPCRMDIHAWYNTVIENVLPGKYIAEVVILNNEETDGFGERVAKLSIRHEDYDPSVFSNYKNMEVAIDSGKAMFSNLSEHKERSAIDDFYWSACDATNGDDRAGITKNAAVSRTGYGEGCYDVYTALNEDDKVIAACIVFLPGFMEE